MATPAPHPPPEPPRLPAAEIFADPEAALAELRELDEQFMRGELRTISTGELKQRLGLTSPPDAGE